MTCYQCGTELPAETEHCPVCGKNQIFTPRLLQAAMDGDQEAIERLYNRTYNAVYQTVKSMIRDEDTVLDIVQDSYVRGFQNLDRLREPGNFPAWMKRIATNTTKNWLKRKKPVLFTELENDDGEMMMDFEDDRTDNLPEAVMDQKETTRLVNEILDSLSDEQRLVVGMFYYQQLSVKQIAEVLDCSENTVKSRLNYARKKIKVQVEDLERHGTKLYSMAPIPFFLWLLRGIKEQGMEMPNLSVLDVVHNQCANLPTGGGGTAARPNKARARPAHSARTAEKAGTASAKVAAKTAGKALAAKVVAGVAAVAVLGGVAVVIPMITGSNDTPQPTEPPQQVVETMEPAFTTEPTAPMEQTEPTPEPEAETPSVTAEQAYQTVLAEYRATMDVDDGAFQLDMDAYFHGNYNLMRYYKGGMGGGFYYAYYDIDGNGVDELLIGADAGGESPEVIDVYAFDGETAVQVINDNALGEWDHLYIYENGVMLNRINNFTQGYRYNQWTIGPDGYTPQLVDDIVVTSSGVSYDDSFNTVFVINGQRLSLDEFESLHVGSGNQVPASELDWKPIPTAEELGELPAAPGQIQSSPAVFQRVAYVGVYRQNTEPYRKLEIQKMADGSYKVLWENTGHVYLAQEINGHLEAQVEGPEGIIILSFTHDGDRLTVEGNEKYYENMYVVSLHGTYSMIEE